jgi:hypothetical protein
VCRYVYRSAGVQVCKGVLGCEGVGEDAYMKLRVGSRVTEEAVGNVNMNITLYML